MTASIIDSITKTPKKQKIRGVVRHAIDVDWLNVNPVPDQGEVIYVTDKNTLKVGDGIHKYSELPVISGSGEFDLSKIVNKTNELPVASTDNAGDVYMYAGDTTSSLTHGYIYECKEVEPDSYDWVRIDVQPRDIIPIVNDATITLSQGGIVKGSFTLNQSENETIDLDAGGILSGYVPQYTTMPTPDASLSGSVVEFAGASDSSFITGYFYKCVESGGVYSWERINTQPTISVINNVTSTSTTDALSANMGKELQDEIDNLKARGRYLSVWNCATGLPATNPTESPYQYKTGDYYIVGTIAASGQTNYRPDGSSYTIGIASTTVETSPVSPDDTYIYDGTHWILQYNTQKTVTFANIAGQPTDNSNLAAALNAKANTADLATVATTGDYDDLLNKPTIPAAQVNSDWNAVSGVAQILNKPTLGTMAAENASDYTKTSGLATVATTGDYDDLINKPTIPTATDQVAGIAKLYNTTGNNTDGSMTQGSVTTALGTKQDTLTAGTNISIDANNVISSIAQESFFRGNFNDWVNVPTDSSLYQANFRGETTPCNSDYIVVDNASGYVNPDFSKDPDNIAIRKSLQGQPYGIDITIGETTTHYYYTDFPNWTPLTESGWVSIMYMPGSPGIYRVRTNVTYYVDNERHNENTETTVMSTNQSFETVHYISKTPGVAPIPLRGGWNFGYFGTWDEDGKNGWKPQYQVEDVLPIASPTEQGITKLYTITGQNTDGTMTQKSVTDALDNKVDKTSDANKVYTTDSTGAQTTIAYDRQNATPSTIVQRDLSGQINIPLVPTADKHAASKQYVDNAVTDKVSKVTPASGTSIYAARSTGDVTLTLSESNTAYTVPYRTSTGQINVAQTPTSNNNAASKKYVDDSIKDATITITQGGVTKGSFTVNQSTNATIALDGSGSGVDLPSQTGHGGEFLKTDGANLSWDVATTVTYREWGVNE